LNDTEDSPPSRASALAALAGGNSTGGALSEARTIAFDRRELDTILRLYGRKVAEGEWRDYAIDFLRDQAVFSIFRRTSEMPLFRIIKDARLARRQGAYSVVAPGGMILKRGHDLERVLAVFEKRRDLRLIEA
jgi:hypothetical protein